MLERNLVTVPSTLVGSGASGTGPIANTLRLPAHTIVDGIDVGGGRMKAYAAERVEGLSGLVTVEIPFSAQIEYRTKQADRTDGTRTLTCPGERLIQPIRRALVLRQAAPALREARRLCREGNIDEGFALIEDLISDGCLLDSPYADTERSDKHEKRLLPLDSYVRAKVFPAFAPNHLVDGTSPETDVPKDFVWVAFSRDLCMRRHSFQDMLTYAREHVRESLPLAVDVTTIEGLSSVLAAATDGPCKMPKVSIAGETFNLNPNVFDVVGTPEYRIAAQATNATTDFDVFTVDFVTFSIDTAALLSQGLTPDQAHEVIGWLRRRVASDVSFATATAQVRRLDMLCRSADALWVLLKAGVEVENPQTREHLKIKDETLVLERKTEEDTDNDDRHIRTVSITKEAGEARSFVKGVAADGRWQLVSGYAQALTGGPDHSSDILRDALAAYRADQALISESRGARRRQSRSISFALTFEDTDEMRPYTLSDILSETEQFVRTRYKRH